MVGRKKNTRSKEDRISHLPDHLICHILTLVSTKGVVRTSVLSTRWRNLWQLVPGLDLNSREFGLFSEFASFAGRFFDFHKDSWIQKLCLSTDHYHAGTSYLTSWIDVVTRRRIQHLDISVYNFANFVDIPLSLYTCGTLVHLQLYRLTIVNAELVSLPCVKLIDLQYNLYPNEAILKKLISGSPVLEDLTIFRRSSETTKDLLVRSKTLKRIHINEDVHVVIDAPLLQCLKTRFHLTKNVTIINSGFPAKVDIEFFGSVLDPDPNDISKRRVIRDFLTDISRVRELVISCFSWEDIFPMLDPGPLLQFCYLSRLSVTFCYSELGMLPNLLKSCPKLESLILELTADSLIIRGRKSNDQPKVTFQTIVIPCLVSSLKFVELKSPILGYEGEMDLVRYFLKNSTILEKLRVRFSGFRWRKRIKASDVILKELIAMPRCSSACELLVD